ncbi:MAG: ParA family protein [Hyphomicrobiaceae bacterium]|nr:ParA family protein [Hyphomicrobiaceae bacterium]
MALFLAVANRKGGVGKSTISVMLSYALSIWSQKRVLLIDLDAQSNSSLILLGGDRWIETQRKSKNVAAYIEDRLYSIEQTKIRDYVVEGVGDIQADGGAKPVLSLLPGSLSFEDMQDELITHYSRNQTPFRQAKLKCADHFRAAFAFARPLADIIVMDCAPGISNATAAALKLADKVVVPFRPDAVSEFAVDRIAQIVEGKKFEEVLAIPPAKRRYVCLANYVRPGGRDAIYVDTISANHPTLETQMPMMAEVADSFDYLGELQTLDEKYGAAVAPMRNLHTELTGILGL